MKNQTEQEKYYAAKNRRKRWWSDNWFNFIAYPIFAVLGTTFACVIVMMIVMAIWGLIQLGTGLDTKKLKAMQDHVCKESVTIKYEYSEPQTYSPAPSLAVTNFTGRDIWVTNKSGFWIRTEK